MFRESVRARLALWHTAVLAALLIGFAAASYVFLDRALVQRTDQYLEETANAFSAELIAERGDETSNRPTVAEAVKEFRFRDLGIAVYDSSLGDVASSLAPVTRRRRPSRADPAAGAADLMTALRAHGNVWPAFLTVPDFAGGARMYAAPLRIGAESYVLAVVQSLHGQRETLEEIQAAYLIGIPLALILAGFGGYLLAWRTLSPVVAMSARAEQIGAANLHERLPVTNPHDELGQLAEVFNDLLRRLGDAFEQQRRFMADASHELRTPVAIMRGEADIALSREGRPEHEYREALTVIGDEGRHLSDIVNDLFFLVRADAGQAPLRCTELYLEELVAECVRAVRSLAVQQQVELCCTTPADCPYHGDELLLRRVVLNLLDNAIKYSGPGTRVAVALEQNAAGYRITVRDTGPGIPSEAQSRLFERFYRVDQARARPVSSATGGAGLGLAIGRVVAEAHGGWLELTRSSDEGSEFALTLPFANTIGIGGSR